MTFFELCENQKLEGHLSSLCLAVKPSPEFNLGHQALCIIQGEKNLRNGEPDNSNIWGNDHLEKYNLYVRLGQKMFPCFPGATGQPQLVCLYTRIEWRTKEIPSSLNWPRNKVCKYSSLAIA